MMMMAAAVSLGLGCGASSSYCDRPASCPNDTPATQSERDTCKAAFDANKNAPCYSDEVSYLNCQADNIVCNGNGVSDATLSSTKIENNCTNQKANVTACCIKNPNSTVCQ
jgi:hypothetical protein